MDIVDNSKQHCSDTMTMDCSYRRIKCKYANRQLLTVIWHIFPIVYRHYLPFAHSLFSIVWMPVHVFIDGRIAALSP
jgi:hypothetical protein